MSVRFTCSDKQVITRDFLNVNIWDMSLVTGPNGRRSEPLVIVPIHDHVVPVLSKCFDNDSVFERFSLNVSPDGKRFVTGSFKYVTESRACDYDDD